MIITYDDSEGRYDHVMPPIVSQSSDSANDRLLGATGLCGATPSGGASDRCSYGPRLPLIVISPYAKENFVSQSLAGQTSITRFAEDNWQLGRLGAQTFDVFARSLLDMFDFGRVADRDRSLILDPGTGEPAQK